MTNRILIYSIDKFDDNNLYFLEKVLPYINKIALVSKNESSLPIEANISVQKYSSADEAIKSNKDFDEYILANDMFYGPFFDISELLKKMEHYTKWSIDTLFYKNKSFIVYKKNAFHDKVYFAYEKYCEFDYNITTLEMPFLHKFFFSKTKHNFINAKIKRTYEHLKENTKYNTQIIENNLINNKQYDIINKALTKNFVLSTSKIEEKLYSSRKTAGIIYIYPETLVDYCYKYASNFPIETDLYIITTSDNVLKKIKTKFNDLPNKITYRIQQNRGRDNTALLVTSKDVISNYDYICFVHAKESKQNKITSHEFRDHCYNSLLYNKTYVNNLLNKFEENEKIGMLIPYPPEFEPYCTIGNEWLKNFNTAKKFLKNKTNKKIELNKSNIICTFGNMFWFRKEAFNTLLSLNITFDDFEEEPLSKVDGLLTHALERIIPTLINYDSYYTAYVIPDSEASFYIDTLISSLKTLKK